jgi:hypothetical protein
VSSHAKAFGSEETFDLREAAFSGSGEACGLQKVFDPREATVFVAKRIERRGLADMFLIFFDAKFFF